MCKLASKAVRFGLTLVLLKMGAWPAAVVQTRTGSSPASRQNAADANALYIAELQRSLEKQTRYASSQKNDEALWASLRRTANRFLYGEWRKGKLLGDRPEQAFYVKCDRTTMSQTDINLGRVVVLVGVATVKPAEFAIFRINQSTAGHRPVVGQFEKLTH
jgi:phage tail sheath protein FI